MMNLVQILLIFIPATVNTQQVPMNKFTYARSSLDWLYLQMKQNEVNWCLAGNAR